MKLILSGEPLKESKINIGKALEVDARLLAETDAKYTDLYSYWEKIRQHENPLSLLNTFWVPSTLRYSSAKIAFNPMTSMTKELSLSLGFAKVSKENGQTIESMVFPYHMNPSMAVDHMQHIQKTMTELNNQGTVVAIKLDAGLKSQSGSYKGVQTALSFGLKKGASSLSEAIKVVSHAEVESVSTTNKIPVYDFKFISDVDIKKSQSFI